MEDYYSWERSLPEYRADLEGQNHIGRLAICLIGLLGLLGLLEWGVSINTKPREPVSIETATLPPTYISLNPITPYSSWIKLEEYRETLMQKFERGFLNYNFFIFLWFCSIN